MSDQAKNSHKIQKLSKQQVEWLTRKIQDSQQLDFTSKILLDQFLTYLDMLKINKETLGIIKLLIKKYGICIVVFLDKFYKQLDNKDKYDQFVSKNYNYLKKLAGLIKQQSLGNKIGKIQFVFKYGITQNQKPTEMNKIKKQFVNQVLDLQYEEQLLKQVKNKKNKGQRILDYIDLIKNRRTQWKNNKNFNNLMKKSLQKYIVSQQQINRMLQIMQNQNDQQNNSKNEMQFKTQKKKYAKKQYTPKQQSKPNKNNSSHSQQYQQQQIYQKKVQLKNQQQAQHKQQLSKQYEDSTQFSKSQSSQQDNKNQQKQQSQLNDSHLSDMNFYKLNPLSKSSIKNFYQSQANNPNGSMDKILSQSVCHDYDKFVQNINGDSNSFVNHNYKKNKNINIINSSEQNKPAIPKQQLQKHLCCRKYFIYQQQIHQQQNLTTSYLYGSFPFKKQTLLNIKQQICSMLNHDGGNIYIGIVKQKNKYIVIGHQFNQNVKQSVLRNLRQIGQSIQPDILTHKMYNCQFVPIKQLKQNKSYQFMPGQFVVKISVKYGLRDQVYSYKQYNNNNNNNSNINNNNNTTDYFPFRQKNKIILKQGRSIFPIAKSRMQNPLPIPIPLHNYPCQKPQIGQLLNQTTQDTYFYNKYYDNNNNNYRYENNNRYDYQYDGNDNYYSFNKKNKGNYNHLNYVQKTQKQKIKQITTIHKSNLSPQKYIKQKQYSNSPKKQIIVHFDATNPKYAMAKKNRLQNPYQSQKDSNNVSNRIENKKKQQNKSSKQNQINKIIQQTKEIKKTAKVQVPQVVECYFYIIGLSKNQLSKALQKKDIVKEIQIQQKDRHQLVLKAFDKQIIIRLRKFLKKVVQKYKQLNIQYYELSRQIQINKQNVKKIAVQLKKLGTQYQILNGTILKFRFFKDSLNTFLVMKDLGIQQRNFINLGNNF